MERMTVEEILDHLEELFPDAHCELDHRNSYEMAIAVILSAQTTDASVNRVTPALFERFPDIASLAAGERAEIEELISSLGLYRAKARSIQGFAQGVMESECFGVPALAVDTHVTRISKRLGLCYQKDDPETIERKLKRKIPKERWSKTHHQMIFFGRYLCHARKPECGRCPFTAICHEKNKNLPE